MLPESHLHNCQVYLSLLSSGTVAARLVVATFSSFISSRPLVRPGQQGLRSAHHRHQQYHPHRLELQDFLNDVCLQREPVQDLLPIRLEVPAFPVCPMVTANSKATPIMAVGIITNEIAGIRATMRSFMVSLLLR